MPHEQNSDQSGEATAFKPSQYMRARRPHLFSDTLPLTVPALDKGRLEYHLETLTSRKQEQEFEEFCRRMVEAEICPNLKPQTGPTGGGDSKVDASTYPVAPALRERCWWGTPAVPSDGAWAFAFSCKKEWKPKVKEDTEKIANLERSFTKAYFITSQFARDKDRGYLESELTKKHGFEVHILDRSWIVNRVMEHKREHIAIEQLAIGGAETTKPSRGPRDTARQRDLEALLDQLGRPEEYHGNDYALAQDYRQAAFHARGLGKPRHEVDGLFERALTLSKQHGYKGQILRIGYDWAWTSLWWFDDAARQEHLYSQIEYCIQGTPNADDCGLLARQWRLLNGSVLHGFLDTGTAKVDERLDCIKNELARLAEDDSRPNNALQAKTEGFLLDLHLALQDPPSAEKLFEGLKECLHRSEQLGTYPAMDFIHCLRDMGEFYGEFPGYDSLFDEILIVVRKRLGETEEGKLLYERGLQFADKDRAEDVLRCMSQARVRLFKEETMREGIRATLTCAAAYSNMGLYWAARMDAITAAHAAMVSPEALDQFPIEGVSASMRMGWLELSLGRVVPFLAWYRVSCGLVARLASMQFDVDAFLEDIQTQQAVLGCLFLRMEAETARQYVGLKLTLDDHALPMARWALLYALKDIATLEEEWSEDVSDKREDIEDFFAKWKDQPASEQIPKRHSGEHESYTECTTQLFDVRYRVKVKNKFGPIVLAENILGVLEAILSLAKWENLAFIVDEVDILVDMAEDGNNPPDVEMPTWENAQVLESVWAPDMLAWMNEGDRDRVSEYLRKVLFTLILTATADPLDDLKAEFQRWYNEDAPTRALGTSPISIALRDLLGENDYDLAYWCEAASAPEVQRERGHGDDPQPLPPSSGDDSTADRGPPGG